MALGRTYALCLWAAAFVWRTLLFRTTFIAITGSVGKTTSKECLAAILSSIHPAVATERSNNGRTGIPLTILRARPWHRYCVVEIGTDRPGGMIRGALLVRPNMVLILSVARIHSDHFKTIDDTAREKSRLLTFLGRRGIAVLNGSDPRVAAMAQRLRCRVVLYGVSTEFDLWSSDASAEWPSRLTFCVSTREEFLRGQDSIRRAALGGIGDGSACSGQDLWRPFGSRRGMHQERRAFPGPDAAGSSRERSCHSSRRLQLQLLDAARVIRSDAERQSETPYCDSQ